MPRLRRSLSLVVLALLLTATACSSSSDDGSSASSDTTAAAGTGALDAGQITGAVDALMTELHVPGAVVLVRKDGDQYLQAFGTRTLGGDPVTVDDYFRIGSNTKTWTGTVVLQLVQEGKVSLDDPISKYFPDIPNGENITVAQILDMRSGLFDYSTLPEVNQKMDDAPDTAWQPSELVALGVAQPPNFAPGTDYGYSNTNTVIAGMLIEQVTGNSLAQEFQTRIFDPLGLSQTSFPAIDDNSIPDPHPDGYLYGTVLGTLDDLALPADQQAAADSGQLQPNDVTDINPSWGWAAGAGISTATDLANYVEVLIKGGLLSDQMQQQRLDSLEPTNPANPAAAGYGLGLASFGPMLGHDGSMPGYQSFMGYDPTSDVTLIVLTNIQSSPDGAGPANEIARALMALVLPAPTSTEATLDIPAE